MKKTTLCLFAAAALMAGGCWQRSLHPFFSRQDLTPDAKLPGNWIERRDDGNGKPSTTRWVFADSGNKGYTLELIDEEGQAHKYDAWLFTLDQQRFMDIFVRDPQTVSSIPAHHLFKVERKNDSWQLAPLNAGWVRDWLREHPDALSHIVIKDRDHPEDRDKDEFILTAETKQLQRFLREHRDEPQMFGDALVLKGAADKR